MPPKATKGEYIETDTGNKVSRRSLIHGTQHIILGGRTVIQSDACIRGDLIRTPQQQQHHPPQSSSSSSTTTAPPSQPTPISITIGRYTFISSHSVLRPPSKLHRGVWSHHPQKIGDNVFIGRNSVVEAASVGSNVEIGEGCVLGKMCIVKERCRVLDGAVVPAGMVVGVGCVVGGRPGRVVGMVGEGWEGGDGRERWRKTG